MLNAKIFKNFDMNALIAHHILLTTIVNRAGEYINLNVKEGRIWASRLVAVDFDKTEASTISQFNPTTSCMCIIYLLVVSSLLPLFAIPIPRFFSGGDFPDLGAFPSKLKNQLILLFNLFLLLFMGFTVFFSTIYRPHCTISANFYLYLQYF